MIEGVMLKQATKAGVTFLKVGGVADFSFPTSKTRRGRVQGEGEISPTIMTGNTSICKLEADKMKRYRVRHLTPKECWRLMGFSDEDYKKAESVNCNTHLYEQAGNSIVVNVLEAIFSEMLPKEQNMAREDADRQQEAIKENLKSGLKDAEKASEENVLKLLAECWNEFIRLEVQHPTEQREFCDAIHRCQDIVGVRVARRHRPDLFPVKGSVRECRNND